MPIHFAFPVYLLTDADNKKLDIWSCKTMNNGLLNVITSFPDIINDIVI